MKYMNYIEAHKIFGHFIDVISNNTNNERLPFLRKSLFNYSKEDLFVAYKLFMAIAYRYGAGVYSSEEINAFNMLISGICLPWVDDDFAVEFLECKKIIEDKSLWGKIKYRTAIPFVKEKYERLHKAMFENDEWCNGIAFMKDKEEYIHKISELAMHIDRRSKEVCKQNIPDRTEKLRMIIDEYLCKTYDLIGLTLVQEDSNYFFPMPLLYKFSTGAETEKYYTQDQKKYIAEHRYG